MTDKTRKTVLLSALGLLLLIAVVRLVPKGEEPVRAVSVPIAASTAGSARASAASRRQSSRSARSSREAEIVELRVADLDKKPGVFSTGRNPFRYAPKAVVKPAVVKRPEPEEAAPQPVVERQQKKPRPRPPAFTYKYLGSFGPKNKPIAVFSNGEEIVNAVEGDVFLGSFVVSKIGYESVDVGFSDFPDEPPKRLAVGG